MVTVSCGYQIFSFTIKYNCDIAAIISLIRSLKILVNYHLLKFKYARCVIQ